ncbi:MAG: peptidylprolyl isomerase [Clostridia bacterium]|nr:peptidylprolyl isomerase [Clostridia bacterium]
MNTSDIKIEIILENGKSMIAELYPDEAPITVANFIKLIKDNFYDGLIFHRVIKGFMIQGGGIYPDGKSKATEEIVGEFKSNGYNNTLKHTRGVLSMARTMFPNSATSQFFIMHAGAPHLDGQYAAFGKVVEGIEVVDDIANLETDYNDRPLNDCIIKNIRIL